MRVIMVKLRGKQRVSVGNERVSMEIAGTADIDGKPERWAVGQMQNIFRQNDRGAAVLLQDGEDVLVPQPRDEL